MSQIADSQSPASARERKEYTVGWICAVHTELTAAKAFLDEVDKALPTSEHNDNVYALGRMGEHRVVIAILPFDEYGTVTAANAARNMLHEFPNIRIGLMVGIGGGAPTPSRDIRLGDVVVSSEASTKGGVFEYTRGKPRQDQEFEHTGSLNRPPTLLRSAVAALRSQYDEGHQLKETIDIILEKKQGLRESFSQPDIDGDHLYKSDVVHPQGDHRACIDVCYSRRKGLASYVWYYVRRIWTLLFGASQSTSESLWLENTVERKPRASRKHNPTIHYGLIGSDNWVMKDAKERDALAQKHEILCFETEAAGLMNHFPCLVIRGICDYADSHKNKDWQGYAAMTAAAYAKDLLSNVVPSRLEKEKKIDEALIES